MDPFERVPLGRTKLTVSQLGLGSAALGWLYTGVAEEQALATVRRYLELGGAFLDTAPLYGRGLAETRVGRAVAGVPRDSYVLSSKVGWAVYADTQMDDGASPEQLPKPDYDSSYDGALRIVEGSLKRLGLDRIDILLIHDPDDCVDEALQGTYRALDRLRAEGVIGALGAGMNYSKQLARLAREGDFDCFLLAGRYTLLDQDALGELLPLCAQKGIAVYLGGPFNSGILGDPYRADATFNYEPAAREWVERARKIDAVCKRHGVSLQAAAIQFPLGHEAIVSVVTGARSVAELEQNVNAFREPLPADLWAELKHEGLLPEEAPTPTS
jgi:D-threo-aldose 1-dehydrogenase